MATHSHRKFAALVALVSPSLGCAGDYATPQPLPRDDAAAQVAPDASPSVDAETPDGALREAGPRDAADDGNRCMPTPSACLQNATSACVNPCRVTYNQCKASCPNDASLKACIDACAKTLATCQVPCAGDCAACANANASCTGSQDCAAIVFKG